MGTRNPVAPLIVVSPRRRGSTLLSSMVRLHPAIRLMKRFGRRTWIERTGGTLPMAPLLARHFPQAPFIHIYRDGPETANSKSRQTGVPTMAFRLLPIKKIRLDSFSPVNWLRIVGAGLLRELSVDASLQAVRRGRADCVCILTKTGSVLHRNVTPSRHAAERS